MPWPGVAAVSAMVLLVLLTGCGNAESVVRARTLRGTATTQPEAADDEVMIFGQASWAMGYGSIAELKADADIVVIGTASGIVGSTIDERQIGNQRPFIIFTDTKVRIDRVLLGMDAGVEIKVHQTGGTANGKRMEFEDDPLLKIGEQYLLFLRRTDAGGFAVLGGPQGRFVIRGGRVSSLSKVYPQRRIHDLELDSVPLANVEAMLR